MTEQRERMEAHAIAQREDEWRSRLAKSPNRLLWLGVSQTLGEPESIIMMLGDNYLLAEVKQDG